MNNWCICWFLRIFLMGILIFKGLTARSIYKSFGVKGFNRSEVEYKYTRYENLGRYIWVDRV
jgi:hypothetical protein